MGAKAKQNGRNGARSTNGKNRPAPSRSRNGTGARNGTEQVDIEKDFYAWLLAQVQAIQQRRFDAVDWENVVEELDGMARSLKLALASHLRVILAHLLKWSYQTQERELHLRSWRTSIVNSRVEIRDSLEESPSLGNEETFNRLFEKAYRDARPVAAAKMGLSDREMNRMFPAECPWTFEQFMREGFLPAQLPALSKR